MSTGRCGVLESGTFGFSYKQGAAANGIGMEKDMAPTLSAQRHDAAVFTTQGDIARTLTSRYDSSPCVDRGQDLVFDARGNGDGKISPTITGDHQNRVTDYTALCIGNGQTDQLGLSEKAGALNCMHDQQAVITLDRAAYNMGKNAQYKPHYSTDGIGDTVVSKGPGAVCQKAVRRFTPMECERLQGFPDGWTDIGEWTDSKGKKRKTSDANRYKALGNSIAIPFWRWLTKQISAQYSHTPTMASLFDGIGGFPLLWEEVNGKGTAIWASEIEDFCVAVTKYHFGEDET